jgi:uncharacterized membrane protein YccC
MTTLDYVWQAIRIFVACALSYGASRLVGLQEGYWALITAVVVTHPALDGTLSASRDRILGTVIGAITGLAVIAISQFGMSSFVLFWCALAPLAVLTAIKPNLRLCCITLVIVVLLPSAGAPYIRSLERILEILLGTLASIVVTAAIPEKH